MYLVPTDCWENVINVFIYILLTLLRLIISREHLVSTDCWKMWLMFIYIVDFAVADNYVLVSTDC